MTPSPRIRRELRPFIYMGQPDRGIPRDVTHVQVDPSVSRIDDRTFRNCIHLVEVNLFQHSSQEENEAKFVLLQVIGSCAFRNCCALASIRMPETVVALNRWAFSGCESLIRVQLNEGLRLIDAYAFEECRSLGTISIPATVDIIGEHAFDRCTSLMVVQMHRGLERIGSYAFRGCTALTGISVPGSVLSIDRWAFSGCQSLLHVDLMKGLKTIGHHSFAQCKSLSSISIPTTVKKICEFAFDDCTFLVHVALSDGLEEIGGCAFVRCTSLKAISIPSTVEIIGRQALVRCKSLVSINLNLAKGLRLIDVGTFADCQSLRNISIPSTVKKIGKSSFRECYSLVTVNLAEGLVMIADRAFVRCTSLESISVPSTVSSVGRQAFSGCKSLVDLELAEGLKRIHREAFSGCISLCSIAFPSSLSVVESKAFAGCTSLLGVEFPAGIAVNLQQGPCFSDCTALVNVSIPSSMKNNISDSAFGGCSLLEYELCDRGTNGNENPNRPRSQGRFDDLPIHKACYTSSQTTLEDILRVLDGHTGENLTDAYGLTPFHVMATAAKLRTDILSVLLDRLPMQILSQKDKQGKTMMDYLLLQRSSKAVPLVKMVLNRTIMDDVSGWALHKWKSDLLHQVDSICREDDSFEMRRREVNKVIESLSYYTKVEVTSIVELALWKMRLNRLEAEVIRCDHVNRQTYRLICGAEVVLQNVVGFALNEHDQGTASFDSTIFNLYAGSPTT